jgi:hypothetical protein
MNCILFIYTVWLEVHHHWPAKAVIYLTSLHITFVLVPIVGFSCFVLTCPTSSCNVYVLCLCSCFCLAGPSCQIPTLPVYIAILC